MLYCLPCYVRVEYFYNFVLVSKLFSIFKSSIILSLCCKVSSVVKKKSHNVLVSSFHSLKFETVDLLFFSIEITSVS